MHDEIDLEWMFLQRALEQQKRYLAFAGTRNFRDLGGYQTLDGRTVRWERLYRSDELHGLTDTDLEHLAALDLDKIIDFRAEHEKEMRPDRLPVNTNICSIQIPILDSSTQFWHDSRDEQLKDNLRNIDPAKFLTKTNIELATRFTPQMKQFIQELSSANGRAILFHCASGKDRTGYAAAIILRVLGVPSEVVMKDYLLSNEYYLPAYSWDFFVLRLTKGKRASAVAKGFYEVQPAYLSAAFEAIDREFGSFEKYVSTGLGLTAQDIEHLKVLYLE
ncbi:MAG: tyrosine-protein phosphatase [Anaerolineales bacterium]